MARWIAKSGLTFEGALLLLIRDTPQLHNGTQRGALSATRIDVASCGPARADRLTDVIHASRLPSC